MVVVKAGCRIQPRNKFITGLVPENKQVRFWVLGPIGARSLVQLSRERPS